jgi:hypothetical protein
VVGVNALTSVLKKGKLPPEVGTVTAVLTVSETEAD